MSNENPSAEGRFGEKIVTAWFETVINPVINALSVEQQYLGKKNYRCKSHSIVAGSGESELDGSQSCSK